jgi:citrate synthase
MRFLRKSRRKHPHEVAEELFANNHPPTDGDWHIAPGFGSRFNGIDPMPAKIAKQLLNLKGSGDTLRWADMFAEVLSEHNQGWLSTGLAAAVLTDLGFPPRAGAGLLQLFAAPGLLAHGIEFANKPISAMPFPKDEDYVIEYQKK